MSVLAENLKTEKTENLAAGRYVESPLGFGIGVRDESAPNHWKEVTGISFADKKTIFILPGSGTNSAETANGMCKIVQNMLPEDQQHNFQICSMYYANSNTSRLPAVVRAQALLDDYLIPLVSEKDENGDLHRISASKAAHNLRNLLIVTHCYGGCILQEIDKHLNYVMEDLGYLTDERKFIQKQLIAVQHNCIDRDLGKTDLHFTNFIRLSSSDEETSVQETKLGTFYHYIKAYEPAKNDVLYLNLADNTQVLLVEGVTKLGVSDHNGGYWKNAVYKTQAGKKEEQLFKAIFQEAAASGYLIENAGQIVYNALQHQPQQSELMAEATAKGEIYKGGFDEFVQTLQAEYKEAEQHLADENFSAESLSKETLLMEDKENNFLLDKAFQLKRRKAAENIAAAMFAKLPKLQPSKFEYERYMPYPRSQNEEDALAKSSKWAQCAIKINSAAMLKVLLPNLKIERFRRLNFENASAAVMNIAVQEILKKENPPILDRQEYFSQAFTNIYARVEKLPESAERAAMLKILNQRVLAPANGIQRPMSYYMLEKMQTFAQEQNVDGLQKVLQNCDELQNTLKSRSSIIKDVNMR